jgi:hypothetical protein
LNLVAALRDHFEFDAVMQMISHCPSDRPDMAGVTELLTRAQHGSRALSKVLFKKYFFEFVN